jgi:hypothetical protein
LKFAARANLGNVRASEDRITPKLAALHFYQLAIPVPTPSVGTFERASADRGRAVFNGKSTCAVCHVPPIFTEPGWNLHKPEEIGIDAFQADRAPDRAYRTTPPVSVPLEPTCCGGTSLLLQSSRAILANP